MKFDVISKRAVKIVVSLSDTCLAVVYCTATNTELGADFGLYHPVHATV